MRQYFERTGFRDSSLDEIAGAFQLQAFRKGELVVTEGKTSRHIGIVKTGLFQPALRKLTGSVPGFKDFYVMLLEQSICGIDESRHDLIVLSADQRYVKLLQNQPHLLQQIPLQHLASMLGITPRHLSRIRNAIR